MISKRIEKTVTMVMKLHALIIRQLDVTSSVTIIKIVTIVTNGQSIKEAKMKLKKLPMFLITKK